MHSGNEGIWCICLSNSANMNHKMMLTYSKIYLPPHTAANTKNLIYTVIFELTAFSPRASRFHLVKGFFTESSYS